MPRRVSSAKPKASERVQQQWTSQSTLAMATGGTHANIKAAPSMILCSTKDSNDTLNVVGQAGALLSMLVA
eukprot:417592-Pyramimonas_sp.AAC.1